MTVVVNWQQPVLGVVDRKHANTHEDNSMMLYYIILSLSLYI